MKQEISAHVGRNIICGVEVTELSTNKQHTLSSRELTLGQIPLDILSSFPTADSSLYHPRELLRNTIVHFS
jgi:hypothetical protein